MHAEQPNVGREAGRGDSGRRNGCPRADTTITHQTSTLGRRKLQQRVSAGDLVPKKNEKEPQPFLVVYAHVFTLWECVRV